MTTKRRNKTSLVGVAGLVKVLLMVVVKQHDVVADNPKWQLSFGLAHLCMLGRTSIGLANRVGCVTHSHVHTLEFPRF